MQIEKEIKILNINIKDFEKKLLDNNATFLYEEEQFNVRIDNPNNPILQPSYFRLRELKNSNEEKIELTFKTRTNYKTDIEDIAFVNLDSRINEETTITVDNRDEALSLLAKLGFTEQIGAKKIRRRYELMEQIIDIDVWDSNFYPYPYAEVEFTTKQKLRELLLLLEVDENNVSTKSIDDLRKDIDFIQMKKMSLLLEEMKCIERKTWILGKTRHENDAEHSWQIAVNALLFKDFCVEKFDMNTVIVMLLIHDIVEIYAGDTFAYDSKGYIGKFEREKEALEKLISQSSKDFGELIRKLWMDFENESTPEARYAVCMDRYQPMLLNLQQDGGTWKEHNVSVKHLLERAKPLKRTTPRLYEDFIEGLKKLGMLK